MAIQSILDINNSHISEGTATWLENQINHRSTSPVIVYDKTDYGWFVHVFEEDEQRQNELPKDLSKIFNYARKHSCSWIMLDQEGDELINELPTFN